MVSGAIEKRKDRGNVFLFIVLAILVVVIVGLVMAIIIANNKDGDSGSTPGYEATTEQIEKAETLQEIRQKVAEAASWEEYINDKISEYKGTDYEMELVAMKANRLVFEGRVAEALEILDAIDADSLSGYDKIQYYLAMMEANRGAGDTTAVEEYTKLMEETRDKYYEGIEGAGGE